VVEGVRSGAEPAPPSGAVPGVVSGVQDVVGGVPAGPPSGDGSHGAPGGVAAATTRRRRRLVLWISIAAAVVAAALVAVFATASPSSQAADDSSPLLGHTAPAVVGPDQAGRTISLASYRGRWVLVNFSASWCAPCQAEVPQLLAFAAHNTGPGSASILTVEYDQSDLTSLRNFFASRHANWPIVDDPNVFLSYGVFQLPESYLVDPLGTIVAAYAGEVQADQIDSLIARFPASGLPGSFGAGAGSGAGAGAGSAAAAAAVPAGQDRQ
jgi:cytochrome c biogenesis protein CcmG/thiol:disulfide interchange protein DsbE